MTILERIRRIRLGGAVERCHTVRHVGSYSVAAHTWGVLVLLYVLWPEDFARLSPYVLFHDVPEGWVGDVPANVKADNLLVKSEFSNMESNILASLNLPDEAMLSNEDKAKLKACDHLELYFWVDEQSKLGNMYAVAVSNTLKGFFRKRALPAPADQLYKDLQCEADRTYDMVRNFKR